MEVAIVVWVIWFCRVEDKIVTADIAMDLSFNIVHEWRKLRNSMDGNDDR